MISVVLSTYNGEKYIEEQLDSLKHQTLQADEVIICDDKSTDKTVEICKKYIKENALYNWKVFCNEVNMGWKLNFREALKKSNGDLIFLCDQDDIWHTDKIFDMANIMNKHDEILLLASNYTPLYETEGNRLKLSKDELKNDGTVSRVVFSEESFYVRRPGCVYCLRTELKDYINIYGTPNYPHDAFLWRTALMLDGLYIYHKSTIDFRRHSSNATAREKKTRKTKIELISVYTEILDSMKRFLITEKPYGFENKAIIIDRLIEWNNLRNGLLKDKKYMCWFTLIKYMDCFWNKKTFIADIIMAFNQ